MFQRTLVLLKPDAVSRGVVGEIITRFERVGLHIVAMKMTKPDKDFLYHHYETIGQMISRRGQKAFDITLDLMLHTPVIALVLEGVESVELVRKMVGSTEPKSALPGTIRGDYAHMSFGYADRAQKGIPNLIHASGNIEEAEQEIKHWFSEQEIFEYDVTHHKYTR
jgi:nucleoside-diphosphate kinase